MNILRLLLLHLLLVSAAAARTLVVSPALPGADDANPGSYEKPLRTIGRAAVLAQPADVVRIYSGVYREKVVVTQSGTQDQPIRFEAAPGASVIVTGADLLSGWSKDSEGVYSIAWTDRSFPGDDHNPGGTAQVFFAGTLLRKVPTLKELADDTYFVDTNRKRLLLHSVRNPDESPAQRPVEASTRSETWIVRGSHVQTCGLRFRCAANRAQQAMALFQGDHDLVEDCVFEWSNSTGASFQAEDITVRCCLFKDNGQQGFTAIHAHRLRFDACTVEGNNVKNYPRGWEAGGDKIVLTRGAVLENSRFRKNHGSGVWFDISNVDCTVHNCLIADNEDAGIFYEISYGLHAHDNVVIGNGLAKTEGAWGANGGICVSSSPGCLIERNLILGNQQGFCFREQNRTTLPVDKAQGPEVPIWNHDEVIRDNLFVKNRSAQVQGWFDIATERHWPKAMQTGKVLHGKAKDDWAAGYQARKDGVPAGLSLEDLKIRFRNNFYALDPNQPFFIWGADWKRKQEFKDIPSLHKALGFEGQPMQMLATFPVDIGKRDFRLSEELFVRVRHAYPQGPVPDCVLGSGK